MKNNTKTKRIALCVHLDESIGMLSKIYSWNIPDTIRDIEVGTVLTVENIDEKADVLFVAEQTVSDDIERKNILSFSDVTLDELCGDYDKKEVILILNDLANGMISNTNTLEDFQGFDLENLWRGWSKKEKKTRQEQLAERKERKERREQREQREKREEAIIRMRAVRRALRKKEEMKPQREEYAIEFLQKFECSLEQLEKYEWYLRVEDDINDLTRMGLSVGIFCVGENSREELSPKWMQWDTLKINEEYMDGNDDRRPLSLCRRDYKKGAVNNPCSLKELHTPTTRYFEFGKLFMERTSLFIEVKYGDAKTCKIHASERDFVHVSRTASRTIEREATTLKEFEIGEYKLRFEELILQPGEMNILCVRRGRDIPYPDTFFNPELFIERVKRHLSDDGKCYTCQILSDGVWKTLGTTGKMVGSGYIKPYIFNASNNSIEEFDGKSYRIGRYNCGSGIHFSKYYDENRIGYCPGEMAEW